MSSPLLLLSLFPYTYPPSPINPLTSRRHREPMLSMISLIITGMSIFHYFPSLPHSLSSLDPLRSSCPSLDAHSVRISLSEDTDLQHGTRLPSTNARFLRYRTRNDGRYNGRNGNQQSPRESNDALWKGNVSGRLGLALTAQEVGRMG